MPLRRSDSMFNLPSSQRRRLDPRTRSRIQLANLTTSIDEPDPASFLTQMLDSDLPPTWVPKDVRRAVEALNRASGTTRDRLAVALGGRLERHDPSIITTAPRS